MSASSRAGWGAGLMAFGQNLQNQFAENARQRREESLLALKRQWQMEDRQAGWDREDAIRLDEREHAAGLLAAQRKREDELDNRDWTRNEQERIARLGLIDAQREANEALAEQRRNPAGVAGRATALERNTMHFVRVFGMDEQTATLAAQGRLRPDQANAEARRVAHQLIPPNDRLAVRQFTRLNPALAAEIGITESTEQVEAQRLLERHLAEQFLPTTDGFYGMTQQQPQADGRTPETAIPSDQIQANPPNGTYITHNGRLFRFQDGRPVPVQ